MEDIRKKIGRLDENKFESFSARAMATVLGYEKIISGLNSNNKGTKGTPDAYIELENGNYVAFQFTSTKESNIKTKLKKDINVLSTNKCHFKDKIEKVVLCFACNMHSEIELYKKMIEEKGWKHDIYPLDRLVGLCANRPELLPTRPKRSISLKDEPLFDCGERIKQVREDIGLSESEFKELLLFNSVKEFVSIENGEKESPLSLLNKISDLTGASLEWLKHGNGGKYLYAIVHSTYDKETLQNELEGKKIEYAYYCLVTREMRLGLILKFSDHKWKLILFNFDLCFWGWIDDHGHIPLVLSLVRYSYDVLKNQGSYITGRIITKETYDLLESENVFLGNLVSKLSFKGYENHWIDDIFDYQDLSGGRTESYREWYGDWFVKLQEYLVRYSES